MRRLSIGMLGPLLVFALVLMSAPGMISDGVAAEDVEISTTFLTFFKNGGGYIEYHVSGHAASGLRNMIDDPTTMFPFETRMADGDGIIDQNEGETYMSNLDDILTRRLIVLRGVKMENVDVDEHRGLIGSKVNDTREIYFHITFRGSLQYDQFEFNVSGLEPLAVLYGSYEEIPTTLTVDERMYIVSAGMGAYETRIKDKGTLLNLRAPLAAVVTYHGSYTVSSAPAARMEYDHSTMAGNPLILMIFMFLVTILTFKLPKALARENDKERVRQLHLAILAAVILFWLFYALGGNAYLVWFFGIVLAAGSYSFAFQIYSRDWRGMAMDSEGVDLGAAIEAIDPMSGQKAPEGPVAQGPAILGMGRTGVDPYPSEGEVVVMPGDEALLQAVDPSDMTPAYVTPKPMRPEPVHQMVPPPQTAQPAMPVPLAMPPEPAQQAVPPPQPVQPDVPGSLPDTPQEPTGETKAMRCKCGGVFRVPLEPRPLQVSCPHCGTTGTLEK
jgi:hypothetical protein